MISLECGNETEFPYLSIVGKVEAKRVLPRRIFWGTSPDYPERQWLLEALDLGTNTITDFALKQIMVD